MKILNKEITREGDVFLITKTTEQSYDKQGLQAKLQNVQMNKTSLLDQSRRMKSDYNILTEEETSLKNMILQFEEESFEDIK